MKNEKYELIVNKYKANESRVLNATLAFIIGGLIGVLGEFIIECLCMKFHISRSEASAFMIIILIFIGSLCTALGFFDKLVNYARCGLLIPITGFAHSMTSAALDYRKEGLVTGIGANMFKLAGTVIIYGVVSAWFFGMLRLMIGV